ARPREFDLALAHGSHELTMSAHRLGIPSATTHDYEFAMLQHHLGMRAATKVVVPEAIPGERLERFGVRPPKLLRYPGLKEEYYLADFGPDAGVLARWQIDTDRILVVLRPPPDVSLYHRHSNPLFPQTLDHLGRLENVQAVVLPRTDAQRDYVRELELPSVLVPDRAVDAQSLIALADIVVSAGGTMNREAAALGVPVYTTYGGRLGGVDEELIRQGRLKPLTDPRALELSKRGEASGSRVRRAPVRAELARSASRFRAPPGSGSACRSRSERAGAWRASGRRRAGAAPRRSRQASSPAGSAALVPRCEERRRCRTRAPSHRAG